MFFDILIRNGKVIDGTKKDAYLADIGITGDRIVFVGKCDSETSAKTVIDAKDKCVTPGFIDTHSHADCSAFIYPDCESYLRQGITTFIGGQCGDSNAPINNFWMRKYWEYDFWNDIDPFVYDPVTIQPVERVISVCKDKMGLDINWKSFSEYAAVLQKSGIGCNMITLAGHSQIRADVMGLSQKRAPSSEEMQLMKNHIAEAFDAGVWGISTGRDYPPSAYAEFDEIKELAEFTKALGGYYFTHWRRTGVRVGTPQKANKLEGITEALEIALQTGIKTQISHIATGFDIYPESPEMDSYAAYVTLKHLDRYAERGADVAFDVIPGESGGICTTPYLASRFIPWIKQSGSLNQFVNNLNAHDYRKRLVSALRLGKWYAINPNVDASWDKKIFITDGAPCYIGKNIREIADSRNIDSINTVIDLIIENPKIGTMSRSKSMEEVNGLLAHPRGFVCTDTYSFDLRGLYGNDCELAELLPHPHTYCAFPKYILSRKEERLEDVIHKLTGAPAAFMAIKDRGVIKEGAFADILVIDTENLKSNENYIEPRIYPEGIDYVIVNGETAVKPECASVIRAGAILKK